MASPFLNDPEHWRTRAAEMRTLAAETSDMEAKAIMLQVAADYDKLAFRAARRSDGARAAH
jgi:hypothetical protein